MSDVAISFNDIPAPNSFILPGHYVEFTTDRAVDGLSPMPHASCIIAQRDAARARDPALTPTRIASAEDAAHRFGLGSQAHRMVAAYRAIDPVSRLLVVAMDDASSGVAATGSILFTAAATAAGTVHTMIAGRRVRIKAGRGDAAATLATRLVAAINADRMLPVTAAVNADTAAQVDLTARHKGATGNGFDIRFNHHLGERFPPGLRVTVTAMSGGSGDPDIQRALDSLAGVWITDLATPWTDTANLTALKTEFAARDHATAQIGGHVYGSISGSYAACSTILQAHNAENLTLAPFHACPTPPEERAAALTAICAYHSAIDPVRQFKTLVMTGVRSPAPDALFDDTERNLLLLDGGASWVVPPGDDRVRVEYVVTTYKQNASGFADPSYRDLNTRKGLRFLRWSWRAWLAQRFPRHKLAGDGNAFGEGQSVVTPKTLRGEACAWFRELETRAIVEGFDQFKADLLTAINRDDPNRADINMVPNLVNNFRQSATRIDFIR